MNPEQEKMLFEHDIATPLTNLHGAHYLLKLYLKNAGAEVDESLRIFEANIRNVERMLGWYWRIRETEGTLQPATPWAAGELPARLARRILDEELPVGPPSAPGLTGRITIPKDPLEVGLLGAALTLRSAGGKVPAWSFEAGDAFCTANYDVEGDDEALDAERLFRKVFWPSDLAVPAWVDAGFPYLKCVLEAFGGSLELTWSDNLWSLRAVIPTVP